MIFNIYVLNLFIESHLINEINTSSVLQDLVLLTLNKSSLKLFFSSRFKTHALSVMSHDWSQDGATITKFPSSSHIKFENDIPLNSLWPVKVNFKESTHFSDRLHKHNHVNGPLYLVIP